MASADLSHPLLSLCELRIEFASPPDALCFVAAKPFKSGIVQVIYERTPNA